MKDTKKKIMKMNINTVYQIHLLMNQAVYLFEELDENDKFFINEKPLYDRMVELSESLSKELEGVQNDKYTYQLKKLKKMIDGMKIPTRI